VEWAWIKQLAKRFDLDLKVRIRTLSHGNKQKIGIIQAFMHSPELLILDEPTTIVGTYERDQFLLTGHSY